MFSTVYQVLDQDQHMSETGKALMREWLLLLEHSQRVHGNEHVLFLISAFRTGFTACQCRMNLDVMKELKEVYDQLGGI